MFIIRHMLKMILQIGVHNQAIRDTSPWRSAGAQDPLTAIASPMEKERQGAELRGALQNPGKISEIRQGLSQAGSCSEDVSTQVTQECPGPGLRLGKGSRAVGLHLRGAPFRYKLRIFPLLSSHLRVCVVF